MARDGRDGRNGRDGAPGLPGPIPRHEWDGTKLRFQRTDNTWGEWVDVQGIQGKDGLNNYELAVQAGFIGGLEDWLLTIRGEDGRSAYEVAVQAGFEGSVVEFILSLKGERGDKGEKGQQGKPGQSVKGEQGLRGNDGLSAYEVWLQDHEGTEEDFFQYLADKVKFAVKQSSQGAGPLRLKLNTLIDVNVDGVTNGQALVYNAAQKKWVPGSGGGGGAVDSVNGQIGVVVLDIDDIGGVETDATLTGNGTSGNPLSVVGGGGGSAAWGGITGDIADQTDLQTALSLKADTADLADVAFSNDYNDLDNLPTLGTMAAEAAGDYTKTADLSAVAISNDYNDLDNLPALGTMALESASDYSPTIAYAAIAFSGAWADLSGVPAFGTMALESTSNYTPTAGFDNVAFSGSYGDLSGVPSSLPPSGSAGGKLSGTYPNPGISTALQTEIDLGKAASFGISIDGGGSAITTGSKGFITIPYECTGLNWYVVGNPSGSIVIDIKRSGSSIVGAGNKPTLSSATSANAAISGWTSAAFSLGDIIEFNVDSASTLTFCNLVIKTVKT